MDRLRISLKTLKSKWMALKIHLQVRIAESAFSRLNNFIKEDTIWQRLHFNFTCLTSGSFGNLDKYILALLKADIILPQQTHRSKMFSEGGHIFVFLNFLRQNIPLNLERSCLLRWRWSQTTKQKQIWCEWNGLTATWKRYKEKHQSVSKLCSRKFKS